MLAQLNSGNSTSLTIRDSSKPKKLMAIFILCQSCFWCASELTATSNDRCPSCGGAVYREKLNLEVINYNQQ